MLGGTRSSQNLSHGLDRLYMPVSISAPFVPGENGSRCSTIKRAFPRGGLYAE